MSFWNSWSEHALLGICFLIAIGQSAHQDAALVTGSGDVWGWAYLPKQFTTQSEIVSGLLCYWTDENKKGRDCVHDEEGWSMTMMMIIRLPNYDLSHRFFIIFVITY